MLSSNSGPDATVKNIAGSGIAARSNVQLVAECREGNHQAWEALIDKYKNLIYSIPARRGISPDDANDIFQAVAAQLLSELHRIREPEALGSWLIQVTSHMCSRWQRYDTAIGAQRSFDGNHEVDKYFAVHETPESLLVEALQEQTLRDAVWQATPQCRELIRLLFYENVPVPYQQVAASLGVAAGSVGFVRKKCLDRLRHVLEGAGFR
jgi:RNA polymerase sigma factor (sigma-70 family)